VEQLTGVKAHTLRIWEQRYGSVQPHRTQTNIRFYDDEQLRFLINVSLLMKYGMKISRIFEMSHDEMSGQIKNLSGVFLTAEKYSEVMSESLVLSMIELDEPHFEKVLNDVTLKYGFEGCMTRVLLPFLDKVGIMWATNEINVAQEHFISQLIRRKVIVAIDGAAQPVPDPKKFILFLPEGEMHEIGLLFAQYMIKRRGHQAIYLGQSTPLHDLYKVDEIYKSDYILTYFTIQWTNDNYKGYLEELFDLFKKKKIILCGPRGKEIEKVKNKNFNAINRIDDLAEFLNNL